MNTNFKRQNVRIERLSAYAWMFTRLDNMAIKYLNEKFKWIKKLWILNKYEFDCWILLHNRV